MPPLIHSPNTGLRTNFLRLDEGPCVTGDGYYETSLLGWEGINIEITV